MIWFPLFYSIFGPSFRPSQGAGAEAGLRWAPRLSRAALCCPLPAGEGEAPPSRPLSLGQSCHQLPFVRKGNRGLCPLPVPPPGNRGAQDGGAVGFKKATVPQEGESKLAKLRPSLPKADAPHPPSWLQALPLHHHPLAGGGLPDRGGFLTLFSSWKWKPSFRQRGRQALGRGAEAILESAGGGLGPAVSRVGRAGRQAVQSPAIGYACRALLPAVEFFRVFFSHHVEPVCNGSILEGKGTESRLLVSGPDPVQCGRNGRDTHFHGTSQMSGETREVPAQRLDTRSQVRGEGPPAVRADAR